MGIITGIFQISKMLPALVAWFVPALHWFWDGFDCFEAIGSLRHSLGGEPSAAATAQLYHFFLSFM